MDNYLDLIIPFILKAVAEILDAVVDGADMTPTQVLTCKTAYCELNIWGKKFAADTTNTYDDDAVATIISAVDKLLTEAGVPVPVVK